MADINTPILTLKSLNVDESGDSGTFIHLRGVVPGIINSILRFMGINGSTNLKMNASYLEMRTGNARGQSSWFVPTGSLSSVQGGYRKDFGLVIMAAITFIFALILDVFLAMEDGTFGFGVFTSIGVIFAIIMILIYVFTKTMYFEIESGGGMTARIQFQGSIEINEVMRALLVMQSLVAKAQYSGEVVLMRKQKTITASEEQLSSQVVPDSQAKIENAMPSDEVENGSTADSSVEARF